MKSNTLYLLILWTFAGTAIVLALFVVGGAFLYGNYMPIFAAAIMFAVVSLLFQFSRRKIDRFLQSTSPNELVAFFTRTIRPGTSPDMDAWLAHSCAFSYLIYADYDSARRTVQSINWQQRAPLVRASGQCIDVLLCYFATLEYARGLELARSAKEMGTVSAAFPGAKTSAGAFEVYVQIGEILCSSSTDSTIPSLERKLTKQPTLMKLLIAWGLTMAYQKAGDTEKANAMKAYLHKTAPYCKALTSS